MSNDSFADDVLGLVSPNPTDCHIRYDSDGDILEFVLSRESFFARRINRWVTVYFAQESSQPIGCVLKDFSKVLRNIVKKIPGFEAELQRNNVKLNRLLSAQMWAFPADQVPELAPLLSSLRDKADRSDLEAPVPALG